MSIDILDKMTVAGRLGNAELQSLSSIFARIGPNAAAAGFGFDKTLAFIEGLSQIERQPERLATLADSTLRLFTNLRYMKDAQAATGVKFFDKDGSRRDPLKVLADIKKQYDKLGTDKQRALFVQKAFGNADLDTIKGLRVLLSGDMLGKVNQFATQISGASGAIARDLPKAIENSIDQVGRMKSALREAADGFAGPINKALNGSIRFMMDKKENGGLALNGKDMLLGGAALTLGTLATARYGGKAISALAGKFGNVGVGVATGKALETAAGVTPVFVVNMPGEGISGSGLNLPAGIGKDTLAKGASAASKFRVGAALLGGSDLAAIRMMGAGAMGTAGLGVAAAGAAGYGVGTGVSALGGRLAKGTRFEGFQTDVIGAISASIAAIFSDEARNAIAINREMKRADAGLGVAAAGAAGYGVGTGVSALGGRLAKGTRFEGFQTDVIGAISASIAAIFSDEARNAIAINREMKRADIGGDISIKIDQDGRASVTSVKPSQPGVRFNVHAGPTMAGAN